MKIMCVILATLIGVGSFQSSHFIVTVNVTVQRLIRQSQVLLRTIL